MALIPGTKVGCWYFHKEDSHGLRTWSDANGTTVMTSHLSPWHDGAIPTPNAALSTGPYSALFFAPSQLEHKLDLTNLTDTGDEISRACELPQRREQPCESCSTSLWSNESVCWRCGWRR